MTADSNGEVMAIKRYDCGESHTVVGGAGGAAEAPVCTEIRAQSRLFVMDLQSGEQTLLVAKPGPGHDLYVSNNGLDPDGRTYGE